MKRRAGFRTTLALVIVGLALAAVPSARGERTVQAQIVEPTKDPQTWGYRPEPLTVNAGDTIRWVNTGSVPHTVTARDGAFDSGSLDPSAQWSYTATTAGTIEYYSTLWMKGTLTVSGKAGVPTGPQREAPSALPREPKEK